MIIQIFVGLLAFAFVTLTRMQSLKKDAEVANIEFVPKKYFEKEWMGIAASLIPMFIWLFIYPEAAKKYPALELWVRGSFVIMGAAGSWVFQKVLGTTKSWIRGIVDVKTNKADGL